MGDQVQQVGKVVSEIYRALLGTREDRYGCLPTGVTAKSIGCSCGILCLHAPKVYSKFDSCSGLGQACY